MSRGNDGHHVVIRSLEAIFIFDIKKHKHLRTTSRPARWRWLRPSQRRWFSESYSSRRTGSRCCSQRCRSEEEEEMMKVMISSLMTFIFCIKAAGFISSRSDACVYPPASISVWIFAFSPLFFISSSVLNIHELHSNCTCSTSALWTCCIPRGIMRQMKYLSYVHPVLEHRLFISMSESIIQSEMDAKKCCGPNKVLAPHVSANRPPGWGSLSVQDVCVQTPKTLISFVLFSTWAEDKWLNLCEHRTL